MSPDKRKMVRNCRAYPTPGLWESESNRTSLRLSQEKAVMDKSLLSHCYESAVGNRYSVNGTEEVSQ